MLPKSDIYAPKKRRMQRKKQQQLPRETANVGERRTSCAHGLTP
jgi:hypothetical protein